MSNGQNQRLSWWRLHWVTVVGAALTALSIFATVTLAWLGAEDEPTRSEVALYALLAAFLQLSAAWVFRRTGQVDLTHAGASLRRLLRLAARAEGATTSAERARLKGVPAPAVREVVNQLSVELSVLQDGLLDAADDWTAALPELLIQTKTIPNKEDS